MDNASSSLVLDIRSIYCARFAAKTFSPSASTVGVARQMQCSDDISIPTLQDDPNQVYQQNVVKCSFRKGCKGVKALKCINDAAV